MLAKKKWATLTVLPVDKGRSTKGFVCSLADAGTELSDTPLSAVTSDLLDPGAARVLTSLAKQVNERREGGSVRADFSHVTPDRTGNAKGQSPGQGEGFSLPPLGRLLISVPSLEAEPVSLSVVNAVDLVVLGIELGRTKRSDVKRSIELIGRDRIAGCVLL